MPARAPIQPIFGTARTVARLLDMKPADFLLLVDQGAMPGPVRHDRWDIEQIRATMRGESLLPVTDFDL